AYDLLTQGAEDQLSAVPGSGLGILREVDSPPVSQGLTSLPQEVQTLDRSRRLLNLTKANGRASVHRPSYMDYVGIKRFDSDGRFLSCLVYLPRDRYNTENRLRIQRILQQQLHGTSVEHTAYVTESILARLHIIIYTNPDDVPDYDVRAIEKRLAETTRSWT